MQQLKVVRRKLVKFQQIIPTPRSATRQTVVDRPIGAAGILDELGIQRCKNQTTRNKFHDAEGRAAEIRKYEFESDFYVHDGMFLRNSICHHSTMINIKNTNGTSNSENVEHFCRDLTKEN